MKLYDILNEIEKNHELNKHLKLRVYCTDGDIVEGYFDGYTDALNNELKLRSWKCVDLKRIEK